MCFRRGHITSNTYFDQVPLVQAHLQRSTCHPSRGARRPLGWIHAGAARARTLVQAFDTQVKTSSTTSNETTRSNPQDQIQKNFSRICEDFSSHHSRPVQAHPAVPFSGNHLVGRETPYGTGGGDGRRRERERETKRLHQLDSLHQEILLIVMSYIYTHTNKHTQTHTDRKDSGIESKYNIHYLHIWTHTQLGHVGDLLETVH